MCIRDKLDLLRSAIEADDILRVQGLLDEGLHVDETDGDYCLSALTQAAMQYHHGKGMVMFLLQNGADVNKKSRSGRTPLYYTCMTNWTDWSMSRILLEAGADASLKTNDNKTAIDAALNGEQGCNEGTQTNSYAS